MIFLVCSNKPIPRIISSECNTIIISEEVDGLQMVSSKSNCIEQLFRLYRSMRDSNGSQMQVKYTKINS